MSRCDFHSKTTYLNISKTIRTFSDRFYEIDTLTIMPRLSSRCTFSQINNVKFPSYIKKLSSIRCAKIMQVRLNYYYYFEKKKPPWKFGFVPWARFVDRFENNGFFIYTGAAISQVMQHESHCYVRQEKRNVNDCAFTQCGFGHYT